MLNIHIAGNAIRSWLVFLGLLAAGALVLRLLKNTLFFYLKRWADSTKTELDNLALDVLENNGYPYLYYLVLMLAAGCLTLPAGVLTAIQALGKILLAFFIITGTLRILRHVFDARFLKTSDGKIRNKELGGLFNIVNFIVWSIGLLLLLDNLGVKVSALVTGMGIGGVAVALAAQAVLGDLFAYFAILFDKPFETDDFIVTGDYMGTVEHIGIKTIRIRSLGGEQIIFSNSDLIQSRPRNYKRMSRRRVVFKTGVTYSTAR
ncbi:MAG: mechanosensitive ion channel, partial [Elusimicrobiaceae bacterium]|nr:mechanosensitive ion channel [Elusimicrobiaceae bacterium]